MPTEDASPAAAAALAATPRAEDYFDPNGVPAATASALRQGVNLQGWKFWDSGLALTPAMAQRLAGDGFDHARIYFHAGMASSGPVDNNAQTWPRTEAELDANPVVDRVEDAMHLLIGAGLEVVINAVPDFQPGDSAATRQAKLDFFALWVDHVLAEFGEEHIVVETTNEPAFGSAAAWQAVEAQVIGIVRAASPTVTVVSATEIHHDQRWDQFGGFAAHREYRDENIVYSAHVYEPWAFVTQHYGPYTWPADPADNPNPGNGDYDWYYGGQHTRLALEKLLLSYGTEADASGFDRWMIGEFGAMERADPASRQAWFEATTLAIERGGGGWGVWKGYGDDNEMSIYDLAWTPGGQRTLVLDDPATAVSLGLAPRPAQPMTISFAGAAEQDLLHPFGGASHTPGWSQTLALSGAGMGGAGGSARVVRDGPSVTVTGRNTPDGVGVLDDGALQATVTGVQRVQVESGLHGTSSVTVDAREVTAITGDGADTLDVTLRAMAGTRALEGWVWTGGGGDRVTVAEENAPLAGHWLEVSTGPGRDTLDLTTRNGQVRVNAGSADDRIALHGRGGTAQAPATVDGAVGIDTVALEGLRSDWAFSKRADPAGFALLAKGADWGSYLLVNAEYVTFADGSVHRAGALVGNAAPTGLTLTLAPAARDGGWTSGEVIGRAGARDADALHWALSDTAGKLFAIDEWSGEVSIRPGAAATPGQSYHLGVLAIDSAGNVTAGGFDLAG